MAMKKPRPTDGGGNWMDTYGDMVTLLMTFFVMLYSMSSLNQQKWEIFVRSITPNAGVEVEDVAINAPIGEEDEPLQGMTDVPEVGLEEIDMDTLYLTIAEKMNEMGIDGVSISRGQDYTFIAFQDRAFFNGDSSVLTEQGQQVLQVFCDVISPAKGQLEQIDIMAHTAQGDPNRPNNPRTDRMLSAMRAADVCIFIQTSGAVEPEKLVNVSYGQFRPIASNDTREGREQNRRVEILMIDNGANIRSLNEYYEEYKSGVNADTTIVTDGIGQGTGEGFSTTQPSEDGVSTLVPPAVDGAPGASAETGLPAEPAAAVPDAAAVVPDAAAAVVDAMVPVE